jgi:hypothetical protein
VKNPASAEQALVRPRFAFKAQIPGLNLAVELALLEVPGFGWVNRAILSRRDLATR